MIKQEEIPQLVSGKGLRLGLIKARQNPMFLERLMEGALQTARNLKYEKVVRVSVPGCIDLPLAAQYLAQSEKVDAIACIGVLIRGDTSQYDILANTAAGTLQGVQLGTGMPITFGMATVEYDQQAIMRSKVAGGRNLASEAVHAATEMAQLKNTLLGVSTN